jgi:hypothetical protein
LILIWGVLARSQWSVSTFKNSQISPFSLGYLWDEYSKFAQLAQRKPFFELSAFGIFPLLISFFFTDRSAMNPQGVLRLQRQLAGGEKEKKTHLKLGPLNAADTARRVAPHQFGAVDQLRVCQLICASFLHFLANLRPPWLMRRAV